MSSLASPLRKKDKSNSSIEYFDRRQYSWFAIPVPGQAPRTYQELIQA